MLFRICKRVSAMRFKLRVTTRYASSSAGKCIKLHGPVTQAIKHGRPVLALESTIITHGMPFPHNFRTAIEVEDIVQQHGVVPATIGVIDGIIHVGMNEEMLKELATRDDVRKLSRRDLTMACACGHTGGTTVSATMFVAHQSGIKIFVTGGIGGVHKMGHHSLDVSADLRELGRTPITVISAGIKSILDIQRTLEYLETEGVTVTTFGKSRDFPAFFTRSSGILSPNNVGNIDEAASLIRSHEDLRMGSGMLIAVPIPNKFASSGRKIEEAIEEAEREIRDLQISGNNVTPHMLRRVNEMTGGLSLEANVALIKNNADVGAKIAKNYYEYKTLNLSSKQENVSTDIGQPIVIGGCNVDVASKCSSDVLRRGPSNPAIITQSMGGVGRNIAEALWRLNSYPQFISAVGSDYNGNKIIEHLNMMESMDTSGVARLGNCRTGVYNAVFNDNGEVDVATEDTNIHDSIDVNLVQKYENDLKRSGLICVDANIPEATMEYICSLCMRYSIPLLYEPTGELKAGKRFMSRGEHKHAVTYTTPNIAELSSMYRDLTGMKPHHIDEVGVENQDVVEFKKMAVMCEPLLQYINCILVTLGNGGLLSATSKDSEMKFMHYPLSSPPEWSWLKDPVANASGAGDSFTAGFIHGILKHPGDIDRAVRIGVTIAQRTLRSPLPVSEDVSELDTNIQDSDWKGSKLTSVLQ